MKYLAVVTHKVVELGSPNTTNYILPNCLNPADYVGWVNFIKNKSIGDKFSIYKLHEEYVPTTHVLKEN